MIFLKDLSEEECRVALFPVVPKKAPKGARYLFELDCIGVPHPLTSKVKLRMNAPVINCDGNTAIVIYRNLFSEVPRINILEYGCNDLELLPNSEHYSLSDLKTRTAEVGSDEYTIFDELLDHYSPFNQHVDDKYSKGGVNLK